LESDYTNVLMTGGEQSLPVIYSPALRNQGLQKSLPLSFFIMKCSHLLNTSMRRLYHNFGRLCHSYTF